MYTIHCETINQFIQVCAGLVKEGVTFEAYSEQLLIECIGGY